MSSSSSYACNESLLTYISTIIRRRKNISTALQLSFISRSFKNHPQSSFDLLAPKLKTSQNIELYQGIRCREHKLFLYQTKTSTTTIKNSSSKQILDMANFLLLRHQTSGTTPKFLAGVRQHVPSAYLVLDLNCAKKREREKGDWSITHNQNALM